MQERLYTEDEIENLRKLYVEDEELDEIKKYIDEKLLSKFDWRVGFKSLDVYNKSNFVSGILEKLQAIRRTISCTALEKTVDLLFTLGFSYKRIVYVCWKLGFSFENRQVVTRYIRRNKFRLERARKEFMLSLTDSAQNVFQEMQVQVKDAERETLIIYLKAIDDLQEELKKLSVIDEYSKYVAISSKIDRFQNKINTMHGINEMREQLIKSSGKIAEIEAEAKAKAKYQNPQEQQPLPMLGQPAHNLID